MIVDIEWKVIYVGSAESSSHDQVLDELLVGPVPVGINKFILQTDAPDPSLIPLNDRLGITVILVTCSYKDQEFARIGYYVNNEYRPFDGYNEEEHGAPDVENLDLSKVCRQIMSDKPRVTRFPINWQGGAITPPVSENDKMTDEIMDEDEVMENSNQNIFSSPARNESVCPQNVVSPDTSCLKDVVMSM